MSPRLQDSGSYYFGWRNRRGVYWWGPDLDLIGGLLIESQDERESEKALREWLDFLESQGAVFSSVSELVQYARLKNWPHLHELESMAGRAFSESNR